MILSKLSNIYIIVKKKMKIIHFLVSQHNTYQVKNAPYENTSDQMTSPQVPHPVNLNFIPTKMTNIF